MKELLYTPAAWLTGAGISSGSVPMVGQIYEALASWLRACPPEGSVRKSWDEAFAIFERWSGNEGAPIRFEQFMAYIRESWDPDLTLCNRLFDEGGSAKWSHLALAALIRSRHTVFTTNFDGCIENAWEVVARWSGDPKTLNVRASAASFKAAEDDSGTALFKLHGSLRVMGLSEDEALDTIQTELDALGQLYAPVPGASRSDLEPGYRLDSDRHAIFERELKRLPLVVVGYSGSDDFDIGPSLCSITTTQPLHWIFYRRGPGGEAYMNEAISDAMRKHAPDQIARIVAILVRLLQTGARTEVCLWVCDPNLVFEEFVKSQLPGVGPVGIKFKETKGDLTGGLMHNRQDDWTRAIADWGKERDINGPAQMELLADIAALSGAPGRVTYDLYEQARVAYSVAPPGSVQERWSVRCQLSMGRLIAAAPGQEGMGLERLEDAFLTFRDRDDLVEAIDAAEAIAMARVQRRDQKLRQLSRDLADFMQEVADKVQAESDGRRLRRLNGRIALLHEVLGIINKNLGSYAEALRHHQAAHDLNVQLGRKLGMATCVAGIGVAALHLGEEPDLYQEESPLAPEEYWRRAEVALEQSRELFEALLCSEKAALQTANLALLSHLRGRRLRTKGRIQQAVEAQRKAVQFAEKALTVFRNHQMLADVSKAETSLAIYRHSLEMVSGETAEGAVRGRISGYTAHSLPQERKSNPPGVPSVWRRVLSLLAVFVVFCCFNSAVWYLLFRNQIGLRASIALGVLTAFLMVSGVMKTNRH